MRAVARARAMEFSLRGLDKPVEMVGVARQG